MKRILIVMFLLFSFNCYGEQVVVHITDAQRELDTKYYFERLRKSQEIVNAEIQRKHELDIEVAKFKNALMLERAGASNINVSSYSINRTETNVNQNIKSNNS